MEMNNKTANKFFSKLQQLKNLEYLMILLRLINSIYSFLNSFYIYKKGKFDWSSLTIGCWYE